jgi:TolB-like protein/class 3 adenylate cyclase/Flp pilus assembly protein TadD
MQEGFMVAKGNTRRLAAILAADMVAYSRLMHEDEAGTIAAWQAARRDVIDPTLEAHGGRVVKRTGDGFLAEFAIVEDAIRCAVALQVALLKGPLSFRIGLNLGDITDDGDDIYGDGINIAARLEGLADPGGIFISGAIFDQVHNKVNLNFQDLGDQEVKNITRPIRVYRVLMESTHAVDSSVEIPPKRPRRLAVTVGILIFLIAAVGAVLWLLPGDHGANQASLQHKALPPPDKPSIAVLPFDNLSDDPNQEYFVDGMTEDLITDLAKIKSLFVIARNTVFTYKGKAVVIPDIARDLGIKYVLEGSVRRVGDVVRINAQLIDGASGAHIWAERYDGTLADIFALQDKVTSAIVGQLKITLTLDEETLQTRKDTDNPEAYDAYLRGWQLYRRYTPEDFFEAIPHLERAVNLDPDFGQAWATLASVHWIAYRKGRIWAQIVNPNINVQVSWIGARDKAGIYLEKAKRKPSPLALQLESLIWSNFRKFEEGIAVAEKAVALDPNDPEGHLAMAWALIFAGRAEAAIPFAENAIRLDPYFPANYRFALGTAQLMLHRYGAAETTLEGAFDLSPGETEILAPLAAVYAHQNKNEKARAVLKKYTDFWLYWSPTIENRIIYWPFKREVDIRLFGGGLVKAGLCCDDQLETYISKLRKGGTLE